MNAVPAESSLCCATRVAKDVERHGISKVFSFVEYLGPFMGLFCVGNERGQSRAPISLRGVFRPMRCGTVIMVNRRTFEAR